MTKAIKQERTEETEEFGLASLCFLRFLLFKSHAPIV